MLGGREGVGRPEQPLQVCAPGQRGSTGRLHLLMLCGDHREWGGRAGASWAAAAESVASKCCERHAPRKQREPETLKALRGLLGNSPVKKNLETPVSRVLSVSGKEDLGSEQPSVLPL